MTEPCFFCSGPVNPHDISTFKQVTGFVGGPRKDSMVLREDTGKYACTVCITKVKAGQAVDQQSLNELIEPRSAEYDGWCGQEEIHIPHNGCDAVSKPFLPGIGGDCL